MDFTPYFLHPEGRLRAGWRLLLFVVFFLGLTILSDWLVAAFLEQQAVTSLIVMLAASSVAGLATVCIATGLLMSLLERQPFQAVGLARRQESLCEMGLGLTGGIVLVGGVAVVEWATGAVHFQSSGVNAASAMVSLSAITGIILIAASAEELLFRGYPFQRLLEGSNAYVAVAISSLVFGWLHKDNPDATLLSILNTMLAGVLLSLAYLKTEALWLPISFHFSWNWTLAALGLPVSGIELAEMPWQTLPSANSLWLHGGEYGPEGGLLVTGALTVGIVYLARRERKPRRLAPREQAEGHSGSRLQAPE